MPTGGERYDGGRASQLHADGVEVTLRSIATYFLSAAFGLLPLFFLPVVYAPFDYTKILFISVALLVAVIFFSLSILRSGVVSLPLSLPLAALWSIGGVTTLAALLSGDTYDAFIGDTFSTQSALFTLLFAAIVTTLATFWRQKVFLMRTYVILAGSAVLLGLYHLLRVVLGADTLTFGVFGSVTSSPLGGWNDVALFFGLAILLALVALEQLPLTKVGRGLFVAVVGVSLLMLAMVNFFGVWIILTLVSLLVLVYALTKDRLMARPNALKRDMTVAFSSILVSAVVFMTSLIFVIGGTAVGGAVSKLTGVSYIEVRPSLTATIDIARATYSEHAFLGIGPAKFVDAWRLYRDPSLNQTIFWATDFTTGSGYMTTQLVNVGIIGSLAWASFLLLFAWYGLRAIFRATLADRFWYFILTSSFVAAMYLWVMSLTYTPSAAIILLLAFFTGTTFSAIAALQSTTVRTWSIGENRTAGFVLVGCVMVVIIGAASSLYYLGRHYAAVYSVAGAVSGQDGSPTLEVVEQKIAAAYRVVASDQFARQIARLELNKLNALIALQNPGEVEQQQFQLAAANGINAAGQAVQTDRTEPENHMLLGGLYSVLAAAGVDGAADRAEEAFTNARQFDPQNPMYALLEAQLAARVGNRDAARAKVAEAVALKPNYTDALVFTTQLDVADGKVADAITTTRAIIALEPNNPARYYQLGILLTANKDHVAAITALTQAVVLNPNYSNARFLLAQNYREAGNGDAALKELAAVLALNPGNKTITDLMAEVEAGTPISSATTSEQQLVTDETPVAIDGDTVTTTETPDTSLIVPINPVNDGTDETP